MEAEETRTAVRVGLAAYGLTYLWLVRQLEKWEGVHTDNTSLMLAVTGKRTTGRYAELVERSDRVLRRYGEMYGNRIPQEETV